MKIKIKKENFYFYSVLALASIIVAGFLQLNQSLKSAGLVESFEKRVIKCQLPLNNEKIQNVYYVAESLQQAKQLLFNSKNGLYFDNSLYVKTTDFEGVNHVVSFEDITCDSVGAEVSLMKGAI